MRILRKIGRVFDLIEGAGAYVAAGLIVIIMLLTSSEIVMRYFLQSPTFWTLESSRLSLLYVTFLSVAWLQKNNKHVIIDVIVDRLSPRVRTRVNIATYIISAIAWLVVTWYGVKVALYSGQMNMRLPTELRTPVVLVISAIPLGSFLFSIRILRQVFGHWKELNTSVDTARS